MKRFMRSPERRLLPVSAPRRAFRGT